MESITLMLPHPHRGLLSQTTGLAVLPKTLPQQLLPLEKSPDPPWGAAAQTDIPLISFLEIAAPRSLH